AAGLGSGGLISGGLASGGGAVSVKTSGLLATFCTASLGDSFASPILSTIGDGLVTSDAVFDPAVSWLNSLSEMTSASTESSGDISKGLAENETTPHVSIRACPIADMV